MKVATKPTWSFALDSPYWGAIARGDRLYVATESQLDILHVRTGALRARAPIPARQPRSILSKLFPATPALGGPRISAGVAWISVAHDDEIFVVAIDASTGAPIHDFRAPPYEPRELWRCDEVVPPFPEGLRAPAAAAISAAVGESQSLASAPLLLRGHGAIAFVVRRYDITRGHHDGYEVRAHAMPTGRALWARSQEGLHVTASGPYDVGGRPTVVRANRQRHFTLEVLDAATGDTADAIDLVADGPGDPIVHGGALFAGVERTLRRFELG